MLTTGFQSVVPVTLRAVPCYLFVLASSVCKSLQCLISTLTQGSEGGHLFRLTCSVVLWGGRNTANKYHWCVWGVLTVYGPHWVSLAHGGCAFPVYTAQTPGCFEGNFPKRALCCMHFPGLSCSGSGSPQRHRLGWACVFCPSQVREAQATRSWQAHCPGCAVSLITSLVPLARFTGCATRAPSQVCRVSPLGS